MVPFTDPGYKLDYTLLRLAAILDRSSTPLNLVVLEVVQRLNHEPCAGTDTTSCLRPFDSRR